MSYTASNLQDLASEHQNQLMSRVVYLNARALGGLQVVPISITYSIASSANSNFFNHSHKEVDGVVHVGGEGLCFATADFNSIDLNNIDLVLPVDNQDAVQSVER